MGCGGDGGKRVDGQLALIVEGDKRDRIEECQELHMSSDHERERREG